jgi:hypothetical protein
MALKADSTPEQVPDDQAYDVPKALSETARELDNEDSSHTNVANFFEQNGVGDEIVTGERSLGTENSARIKMLKFVASILRRTSNKNS